MVQVKDFVRHLYTLGFWSWTVGNDFGKNTYQKSLTVLPISQVLIFSFVTLNEPKESRKILHHRKTDEFPFFQFQKKTQIGCFLFNGLGAIRFFPFNISRLLCNLCFSQRHQVVFSIAPDSFVVCRCNGSFCSECGCFAIKKHNCKSVAQLISPFALIHRQKKLMIIIKRRSDFVPCTWISAWFPLLSSSHWSALDYLVLRHLNGSKWWNYLQPLCHKIVTIRAQNKVNKVIISRHFPTRILIR